MFKKSGWEPARVGSQEVLSPHRQAPRVFWVTPFLRLDLLRPFGPSFSTRSMKTQKFL